MTSAKKNSFRRLRPQMVICTLAVVWLAASHGFAVATTPVEGGATIAGAPTIVWGDHEDGVGTSWPTPHPGDGETFWRARLFRGDLVTINLHLAGENGCAVTQIEMFRPAVNDSSVSDAKAIDATYESDHSICDPATRNSTWLVRSVPFRGLGTLWLGVSSEAPTFSFTAHDQHRTTVRAVARPKHRSASGHLRVVAHVTSQAGAPTGGCTFADRSGPHRWTVQGHSRVHRGQCAASITIHRSGRIRVVYAGNQSWQRSTALTGRVTA